MSNNLGVLKFIARRLALGILTLFVVSLVVFAATQLLPSDPAQAILGRDANPTSIAHLRAELGLDHTAFYQYTHWLKGIVTGDPGDSYAASVPILSYISDRVVNSLFLLVLASAISIPMSLWLGGYTARKRDSAFDNVASNTMLAVASLPEFVVGIIFVLVFSGRLWHLLPAVSAIGINQGPWSDMKGMVLPTATLVIGAVPYISRVVRASMIEVLESDYIEMARLKGAPEKSVLWRHALPNALGPVFQVIALNVAYFAAGVIVVEALFNYPGIGGALRDAVRVRDIPVIQFLVMVLAAVYVVTNLAADVATVLVTPRPANEDPMSTAEEALAAEITAETQSRRPPGVLRVAFRMWRTRFGLLIVAALAIVALFGRYIAPYGEAEGVGLPFKPSGTTRKDTVFGSANLGHDVWTRFLYGGKPILIAAVLATLLALVLGTTIGLIAAYNRGNLDDVLMRSMDVILSMPQIIAALIVISMFGATTTVIIFTVGISTVPRIARVVRGAAISVVERDFVAAAESLGESRFRILRSELLPNVSGPLLVEANLRLTFSISLIAGIAFLGFTPDPGAANWGLMINENRKGMVPNHWGVTLPVIAIALLTVGTGLIGDGLSRASAGVDRARGDS